MKGLTTDLIEEQHKQVYVFDSVAHLLLNIPATSMPAGQVLQLLG